MSASVLLLLGVIACPVAMGLMMLFMRHGHHGHETKRDDRTDD